MRRDTKIFSSVQQFADIINEQIGIRASLICGKLPAEEVAIIFSPLEFILSTCQVRDLRSKLTKKMDYLNHHLQVRFYFYHGEGSI